MVKIPVGYIWAFHFAQSKQVYGLGHFFALSDLLPIFQKTLDQWKKRKNCFCLMPTR
jgi:hypothetical protein